MRYKNVRFNLEISRKNDSFEAKSGSVVVLLLIFCLLCIFESSVQKSNFNKDKTQLSHE